MKTRLHIKFILLIMTCIIISNNANSQSFGGINLGNVNLQSVNNLKTEFTDFKSFTDSLSKSISTQLNDTNLVDFKELEKVQTNVAEINSKQDSILNSFSNSSKLASDSVTNLLNKYSSFQNKEDSLSKLISESIGKPKNEIDSLSKIVVNLQTKQDSIIKTLSESSSISPDSATTLLNQYSTNQSKQDSLFQQLSEKSGINKDSLQEIADKIALIQSNTDSLSQVFLKNISNLSTFNQDSINKAQHQLDLLQQQLNTSLKETLAINTIEYTSFSLFPNPCIDYFTINSPSEINYVTIYSTDGQLIKQFGFENKYDISSIKSGLYFVQIEFKNKKEVIKLIIQ